jgi:hypoxanthine phosphoribosyltransferase
LDFVIKLIKEALPNATIKTAVLFYKPKSKIKPDYYVEETTDWIVFPWEN